MAPAIERDLQNLIAMRDEEILKLITSLLHVRDFPIDGVGPSAPANPFLMVRPSSIPDGYATADESNWGTQGLQKIEALSAQICLTVGISWATMSTGICSRQAMNQRVGPMARRMADESRESAPERNVHSVDLLAALGDYLDDTEDRAFRLVALNRRVGSRSADMVTDVALISRYSASVLLTHCERLTQRLLAVRNTPRWWRGESRG